jgi:hypothetical protein
MLCLVSLRVLKATLSQDSIVRTLYRECVEVNTEPWGDRKPPLDRKIDKELGWPWGI